MKHIAMMLCAACIALGGAAAQAGDFKITEAGFKDGARLDEAHVLNGFGCAGGNVSPHIAWRDVPQGTKSLAITLYDPDAPTGSGWWHWVAFNIPADVEEIAQGAGDPDKNLMPKGTVQSRTDFGKPGFGGACPPKGHGPHRYQLSVHALNTEKLALDENASAAMVGFFLGAHSLGIAQVTGIYVR